jgi:hypothetical protein
MAMAAGVSNSAKLPSFVIKLNTSFAIIGRPVNGTICFISAMIVSSIVVTGYCSSVVAVQQIWNRRKLEHLKWLRSNSNVLAKYKTQTSTTHQH